MQKFIDLKDKNLNFVREQYTYKLVSFKTTNMTINTLVYKNEELIQEETIPFAQLPKKLKKTIKPK